MTNEQVKQNAEVYASTKEMHSPRSQDVELDKLMIIEDYIAGAHSRDEEVKQWKESKRKLRLRLMQEIHELRNPWISVADRLPEKINKFMSEPVLCRYTRRGKEYFHVSQYDFEFDKWQISNVTHWMPIPGLSPDEQLIAGLKQMQQDLKKGGTK